MTFYIYCLFFTWIVYFLLVSYLFILDLSLLSSMQFAHILPFHPLHRISPEHQSFSFSEMLMNLLHDLHSSASAT